MSKVSVAVGSPTPCTVTFFAAIASRSRRALHAAHRGDRDADGRHVVVGADPLAQLAVGVVHHDEQRRARGERVDGALVRRDVVRPGDHRDLAGDRRTERRELLGAAGAGVDGLGLDLAVEGGRTDLRDEVELLLARGQREHRLLQTPAGREREVLGVRRLHRLRVEAVDPRQAEDAAREPVDAVRHLAEGGFEAVLADVDGHRLRGTCVEGDLGGAVEHEVGVADQRGHLRVGLDVDVHVRHHRVPPGGQAHRDLAGDADRLEDARLDLVQDAVRVDGLAVEAGRRDREVVSLGLGDDAERGACDGGAVDRRDEGARVLGTARHRGGVGGHRDRAGLAGGDLERLGIDREHVVGRAVERRRQLAARRRRRCGSCSRRCARRRRAPRPTRACRSRRSPRR